MQYKINNEVFIFIAEMPPIFGTAKVVQIEMPPIFGTARVVQIAPSFLFFYASAKSIPLSRVTCSSVYSQ